MATFPKTLVEGIEEAFSQYAEKNAVCINQKYYTYKEIEKNVELLAQAIREVNTSQSRYIAVFGYRSFHTYTSILGVLFANYAYMPLNPEFPAERLTIIMKKSCCNVVILLEECADNFSDIAANLDDLVIICPSPGPRIKILQKTYTKHSFEFPDRLQNKNVPLRKTAVSPKSEAYLLFTSGSTGEPKGVMVTHKNVCEYLQYIIRRYQISCDDRLSQMFDITFDLSVHDIFSALFTGACFFVVPKTAMMAPAKFIQLNKLTLWFSVPSVAMFMEKMRLLKPNCFPTIRYSLFCGEAMPLRAAKAWQIAAPNSVIENLYGPTETTIAITHYRWDPEQSPENCRNDILPIGWPFDGQETKIVSQNDEEQQGELYLAGSQITLGYLNDQKKTDANFVTFDEPNKKWYATGDLVTQNTEGCLYFLGRKDEQVQIRGYRVELLEIDRVLRRIAGTDLAICVPCNLTHGHADTVYACIEGEAAEYDEMTFLYACKRSLPHYMVPSKIVFLDKLPLNNSGKISRKQLIEKFSG